MNFACVFPGQGSQSVGMLKDIIAHYSELPELLKRASDILGYDLQDMILNGPEDNLNMTEHTQPAMLCVGVAAWKALRIETDKMPSIMAGHSLGEYTALVCARSIQFDDAVKLVAERGRLMQNAVAEGEGALAAILGLDDDKILSLCEQIKDQGVLEAANFNSPGQVVIAGNTAAVEAGMALAKDMGAKRALKLAVSVPSHCSLMKHAAEDLEQRLTSIDIAEPVVPVVQNVDGKVHTDPKAIIENLKQQIYRPVRWVDAIHTINQTGVQAIAEVGPGRVLAGLNRRIDKSVSQYHLDNLEQLTKFVADLEQAS